jgi:4-amino-4-deoxy-L-arabinose transferase-like glycosyltransferase
VNLLARPHLLLGAWLVALFVACLVLHTRHNDFPYFYHPDEPDKVEQVLSGEWNFHHPMLLLSTTRAVVKLAGVPPDRQAVVETGRNVSAVFVAIAVCALSLFAWRWRGWRVALPAGFALLLHHQLYELAHYMKEDTALLMGVALTFLAAHGFWQSPTRLVALGLGVAVALAVSGKYIGISMLAVALPVLWFAHGAARKERWICFLLGLLLVFALVNLPLLASLSKAQGSLARETTLIIRGQDEDAPGKAPHWAYWEYFLRNTTPAIWLLLVAFYAGLRRRWESLTLPERALVVFPLVYAVALSFSPKENDRYFLPASALFTVLAAGGIHDIVRRPQFDSRRTLVAAVCGTLLVAAQLPSWTRDRAGLLRYDHAFQRDDLQEMIDWMRTDVPPEAIVAKDGKVNLPDPKKRKHAARVGVVPQRIVSAKKYVADLGTIEELREQGISYVVVSRGVYGKFIDARGGAERSAKFQKSVPSTNGSSVRANSSSIATAVP